jgi:ketosteroid isomerase-like protein
MSVTAPHEVLQHFLRLMADGPDEAAADLFTADAVFEMPYLPPGMPAQEPGREAFRAHLTEGARVQRFHDVTDVQVHRVVDDPELVVADYRLHGEMLATGKPFALDIVTYARVRDGLIAWSRVYANPLAVPAAA